MDCAWGACAVWGWSLDVPGLMCSKWSQGVQGFSGARTPLELKQQLAAFVNLCLSFEGTYINPCHSWKSSRVKMYKSSPPCTSDTFQNIAYKHEIIFLFWCLCLEFAIRNIKLQFPLNYVFFTWKISFVKQSRISQSADRWEYHVASETIFTDFLVAKQANQTHGNVIQAFVSDFPVPTCVSPARIWVDSLGLEASYPSAVQAESWQALCRGESLRPMSSAGSEWGHGGELCPNTRLGSCWSCEPPPDLGAPGQAIGKAGGTSLFWKRMMDWKGFRGDSTLSTFPTK